MNVRRAGGVMHSARGQKIDEFFREKFPRIVAVKRSNDLRGSLAAPVQEGREGRHEPSHMGRCLGFVLQKVDRFESCVIVHEHE
eukprot:5457374-Pleurochrysis_carterae.AAC.1